MLSNINKRLTLSTNYVNLFEPASSGTKNISVRNPVYDVSLIHRFSNEKYHIQQTLQTGFSKRYWLHTELENAISDSISNDIQGMFFELENKFDKQDSSLFLSLGVRYVDPNFRSAGAQSRRLDYNAINNNTIYPFYTNMSLIRPQSMFDIVSDDKLYNQDLSSVLMNFNPIYSNVLPYGDATPNRIGVYMKAIMNNKNNLFHAKINTGIFKEAIGQGTPEKRQFGLVKGAFKINIHEFLNWQKELTISASSESELTKRGGKDVSKINFFSHHMNASINAELAKKFFVQASYKQLNAKGNEFVTQRDSYGNISYFTLTEVDQKDHMLSFGMLYKFKKNVYANLNYNWWGVTSFDQNYLNYKYNRLILILSVKL